MIARATVTPRAVGLLPPTPTQAEADAMHLQAIGQGPTAAPVNTVAPAVTGTATVGSTLTCSTGTWSNLPVGYAYQWQRGATPIGTGTNSYQLVAADSPSSVTCVVSAHNAKGVTAATSNATAVP
jgi:hypothetical protein